MTVEKTLRLESTKTLSTFPPPRRQIFEKRFFHQGLLRREETKKQSNGVSGNLLM
jgi:hypothetical protein